MSLKRCASVLLLMVFSILSASTQTYHSDTDLDEVLDTLNMIRDGYQSANTRSPFRIIGRISYEQRAEDGGEIPQNKIDTFDWLNFTLTDMGDKWRYEQDFSLDPSRTLIRVSNGDAFYQADGEVGGNGREARTLRIFPTSLSSKKALQDQYGKFFSLNSHEPGYTTVVDSIDSLISRLTENTEDSEKYRITTEYDQEFFNITVEKGDFYVFKATIDPEKGFNLVAKQSNLKYGEGQISYAELKASYQQASDENWYLEKAAIVGNDRGTVFESNLEVQDLTVGDFEYDPYLLTLESVKENLLNPTRIYDYRFNPKLEYSSGTQSFELKKDALESLLVEAPMTIIDDTGIQENRTITSQIGSIERLSQENDNHCCPRQNRSESITRLA